MIRLLTEKDRQIIIEYLERNHMETTFIIGNVTNGSIENNKEIRRCADYYGFFKENVLKGLIPFYNLGSCIPHYEDEDAVPYFVDLMKEREVKNLLGMKKIIQPIYELVKDYKTLIAYDESSYMVNRDFKPFKLEDVSFVKSTVDDTHIDFIVQSDKGFDKKRNREDIIKNLTQANEGEDYTMLVKDEKIVAQALIQSTTSRINQIGGVYTLESERGKGYCKAVVSELCKRIIERGKVPTLYVKKNNTPAVKAYISLGFEHFDNYLIIKFKKE